MAKQVYTVLKLKDQFSGPMKIAAKNTKEFQQQAKFANTSIKKFGTNLNNSFKNTVATAAKATAAVTGLVAAMATKTGFSEAMNLEGYRLQLETATKDTKKAAEIMSYSIKLANKTPFEGGTLVEGAAKLEAMGMSAQEWLPKIGDMAAATNKPFDQAVEAVIDAQAGELERLKEFGITKAKIAEKANQMFANQEIINNKGQITDQKKFNEAMVALMQDRFTGGMEKQATTMKGLCSTVTGITKTGLASIVGITEDGSIRQGSLYEMLKDKIKSVADTLTKWQSDGTLQKIGDKVTSTVTKAIDGLSAAFMFLKDNINWLLPVAGGLLAGITAFSVVLSIASAIRTLYTAFNICKIAMAALNITMAVSPLIWIPAVIALAVAAGIALWQNWDKIKKMAEAVKKKIMGVVDAVKKFFGFTDKKKKVKLEVETTETRKTSGAGKTSRGPRHALGTTYFAGGETQINEGGRKESAILPSGTQIIPADKTKEALGGRSIKVNIPVTIQGNVIGNKEFANQVGAEVYRQVVVAISNM